MTHAETRSDRADGSGLPNDLSDQGTAWNSLNAISQSPPTPSAEPSGDGLPTPRRYWAAAAIWLAIAMSVLDSSIANVALPTIARDLDATAAKSLWVVNAYQIAITMSLLPVAAIAELLGYRRVYGFGLTLFVVASLGCALATDLAWLAIARFIQGFGAASIMAINGALVRFTYPRARLGRGIGYNALVVALSAAVGPTVAAAILSLASWQWLFAVNVPLGLLSLAVGMRCLPGVRGRPGRFDVTCALLNVVAFAALFMTVSDVAHGEASVRTLMEAATALISGVLLVRRARGQPRPLIPIDLLRIPMLRLSYATSSCSFAAQMITLVMLPFYLQGRFGFDHVATGLLITPMPIGIAIAAPVAGRLVERVPAGLLGGIGLAVMAVGTALLAAVPDGHSPLTIAAPMLLAGMGFGLFQTPNNRTMLGVAPAERSGAAAGMLA